jgi:hypothetical protein
MKKVRKDHDLEGQRIQYIGLLSALGQQFFLG